MFEVTRNEFKQSGHSYLMPIKEQLQGSMLFILCFNKRNYLEKSYMMPLRGQHGQGMYLEEEEVGRYGVFSWSYRFTDNKTCLDIETDDISHFLHVFEGGKAVCFTDKELISSSNNLLNFILQI